MYKFHLNSCLGVPFTDEMTTRLSTAMNTKREEYLILEFGSNVMFLLSDLSPEKSINAKQISMMMDSLKNGNILSLHLYSEE